MFLNSRFIKKAVETTAPETSAPEATEADTTSPQTTAAETTTADTSASSEDGCGSVAALSLIPSAVALCAVFGRKRK